MKCVETVIRHKQKAYACCQWLCFFVLDEPIVKAEPDIYIYRNQWKSGKIGSLSKEIYLHKIMYMF